MREDTPGRPVPAEPEGDGGYNSGMAVFSYVIGGIVVWSLIGWGLDNLLKTRWFVLAGALVGIAGGIYLTMKHGLFTHRTGPAEPRDPGDDAEADRR
ncbi:AtpZ/AtpI family protein [Sinomonas soli]